MKINNFTRLSDARPNFNIQKFEMPRHVFSHKIKPITTTTKVITPQVIATSVLDGTNNPQPVGNPSKFGPGAVTTALVVVSVAVILVTTILIIQTT
jgi:hypothetical protein